VPGRRRAVKFKYDAEFRAAHPETIGETDQTFDRANYCEWLETHFIPKVAETAIRIGTRDMPEILSTMEFSPCGSCQRRHERPCPVARLQKGVVIGKGIVCLEKLEEL
jgi:hypothetical protein